MVTHACLSGRQVTRIIAFSFEVKIYHARFIGCDFAQYSQTFLSVQYTLLC